MAPKKYRPMVVLILAMLQQKCHGFVVSPVNGALTAKPLLPYRMVHMRIYATGDEDSAGGVEMVSLAALGDDHEAVGETMGKSMAAWLDVEWMPQEVHNKMGTSVANTYVACRSKGVDDVSEIMTQVTDDLYERWSEYNADAFVNAWDIGNYVADYLIAKSGGETCGCSTQIVG